jgi:hypothetical protein
MNEPPSLAVSGPSNPSWSWGHAAIALTILLASSLLIFARLGHYALWDDEAMTALPALSVWRTGDTNAIIDHNIVAYESGKELRNFRFRYMPPLPSYLAAPFVGLMGNSALAARLPFAIAGLACIVILLWWLYKDQASLLVWGIFGIGIVGNVSLFLHFRNARYYSPAILFTAALAYLYLHWDGRRRPLFLFSILSLCLWTSNYLTYLALYACLAIDYLFWGRKERWLGWQDWLVLILPQIAIGIPLIFIWNWNPFSARDLHIEAYQNITDKLVLLWYNLRDSDLNERGPTLLLLLAPALYFATRDKWLLRGTLTLLTYVLAITLTSHHLAANTITGDMRFLSPLIPLTIFLGAATIRKICRDKWLLALPLAIIAFATNFLQIYPYYYFQSFRFQVRPYNYFQGFHSTVLFYAGELLAPPNDPYKEAAKWINSNVREGQTIWTMPFYTAYPLMYHAPKAIYAWQISYPPEAQFQSLDPIHFRGRVPPDYIIAFARVGKEDFQLLQDLKARIGYDGPKILDVFGQDLYKPELYSHTFEPVTDFDRGADAVYIFQRTSRRLPGSKASG